MTDIKISDHQFACEDGIELTATLYLPEEVQGAVMIAPATGIKRGFYHHFARFLAQHHFAVLTFDNRGIGDSLVGSIKDSEASLQCWGQQDLPAALNFLKNQFPDTKYHLVGHSAGGQLIGLMPNASDLSSVYNYACSSGKLVNMRLGYQLKAHFFMNFFIPVTNLLFGFTQAQWVGMGEPLPRKVARQWQQWCNGGGYVKTAFGKTIHQHHYHELEIPTLWVNAVDDDIANDKNVDDMVSVFDKLQVTKQTLNPLEYGLKEIGHMKFFSRKSQDIWAQPLAWLNQHNR